MIGRIGSGDRHVSDAVVEFTIEGDFFVDRATALDAAGRESKAVVRGLLYSPDQVGEAWIGRRLIEYGWYRSGAASVNPALTVR